MKKILNIAIIGMVSLFVGIFYGLLAQAQETASVIVASTETDVIQSVFAAVTNGGKMSAVALAGAIVQILIKILSLPSLGSIFPGFSSQRKLVAISFLSMVVGVLTLREVGTPLIECLIHSATLAAFQVFAHQYYKEFVQKPASTPTPAQEQK